MNLMSTQRRTFQAQSYQDPGAGTSLAHSRNRKKASVPEVKWAEVRLVGVGN